MTVLILAALRKPPHSLDLVLMSIHNYFHFLSPSWTKTNYFQGLDNRRVGHFLFESGPFLILLHIPDFGSFCLHSGGMETQETSKAGLVLDGELNFEKGLFSYIIVSFKLSHSFAVY